MLYEQSPEQIADKLLSQSKTIQLLQQNDKMLLTYNKTQLFRRWPQCMMPVNAKITSSNIYFTSMLNNMKQKAYMYDQTMKPIQFNFQEKNKSKIIEQREKGEQGEFREIIEVGDNQQNPINKSHHTQNTHRTNSLKKQFSPFLPNCDNPFDTNANAKTLKQKFDRVKIDSNKRNIAALIQENKKTSQQKQFSRFGKSIPKKPTDSIDINDILRYTLGVKREKQQGVKPQTIKNPFVRVPPKYYNSMNDFYQQTK